MKIRGLIIAGASVLALAGCGSVAHISSAGEAGDRSPVPVVTAPSPSCHLPYVQDGNKCVYDQPPPSWPPPAPTTPPPAVTTLNINVVAGCEYDQDGSYSPQDLFAAGPCTVSQAESDNGSGDTGAGQINAYTVSVTNNNSYPVNVSTVTVGYYAAAGDEISEGTETLPVIQIAAGQTVWDTTLLLGVASQLADLRFK
jgi:hypothetical protein